MSQPDFFSDMDDAILVETVEDIELNAGGEGKLDRTSSGRKDASSDYEGKRPAKLIATGGMSAGSSQPKAVAFALKDGDRKKSPDRTCKLVLIETAPGEEYCCSMTGNSGGMSRFCVEKVVSGGGHCRFTTHGDRTKAQLGG